MYTHILMQVIVIIVNIMICEHAHGQSRGAGHGGVRPGHIVYYTMI